MIGQVCQWAKNRVWGPVLPLELIVFVTGRCPLRCSHCFIKEYPTAPSADLSLEVLKRLAADLPNLLVLMLTGGEPFMRGDLPEVVRSFSNHSCPEVVSISTNGWFPDKTIEAVGRILQSDTFSGQLVVSLSFDGRRQDHDLIRGRPGAYDRALETARRLASLRKSDCRLIVGGNLTLVPQNQRTILAGARELAETGLFSCLSQNIYREGKSRSAYCGVDLAVYRELSQFVRDYSRQSNLGGTALLHRLHRVKEQRQADLIERTCRTNAYQGVPCEAGRNIGVVYSDGRVAPCELLPANWGNIKERRFADVWNDATNRERSNRIRRTHCFCTHECFIGVSLATRPWALAVPARPGRGNERCG